MHIHYGGGPVPMGGSVTIHEHGCEIGQGLHTKCIQIASAVLSKVGCKGGVPLDMICVTPTDIGALPNPIFT